ncbi:MAG TPA: hypothetical protein VMG10_30960 [Gemmataceae bacterium]|nr:hypothetical protein [Gemmataceae bacterium]
MGIGEAEMVTEALNTLSAKVNCISNAITSDAIPGRDETGGVVASLTEAVMGMTAGLVRIAESIDGLADAVRETQNQRH